MDLWISLSTETLSFISYFHIVFSEHRVKMLKRFFFFFLSPARLFRNFLLHMYPMSRWMKLRDYTMMVVKIEALHIEDSIYIYIGNCLFYSP